MPRASFGTAAIGRSRGIKRAANEKKGGRRGEGGEARLQRLEFIDLEAEPRRAALRASNLSPCRFNKTGRGVAMKSIITYLRGR